MIRNKEKDIAKIKWCYNDILFFSKLRKLEEFWAPKDDITVNRLVKLLTN